MTRTMRTRAATTPSRGADDLVEPIRKALKMAREHDAAADSQYQRAGKLLLEARGRLPHGVFKPWVAKHFTVTYQTAAVYMRMAKSSARATFRAIKADPTTRRNVRRSRPSSSAQDGPAAPVQGAEASEVRRMARRVIEAGYRAVAIRVHPDKPGGSAALMARLNDTRAGLMKLVDDWDP